MKTLISLVVLAILLAGGYWKLQNPDAGLDELGQQAQAVQQRLQRGVDTVLDGDRAGMRAQHGRNDDAGGEQPSGDVRERLAALEAMLGHQSDQAAAAAPAVSADAAGPADAEAAGAASANRLQALEAGLVDLQKENAALLASNETAMAGMDALKASVESIRSRLDAAINDSQISDEPSDSAPSDSDTAAESGTNSQNPPGNENFSAELEARMEERFAELDTRIATLAKTMESVQSGGDGATPAASQASVDELGNTISEEIASLEVNAGESEALDVNRLSQALRSASERIAALERRVQTLPVASGAADQAEAISSSLQEEITGLEERIEGASGADDPALVDSLDVVKTQINQLAENSSLTREELQARKSGRSVEYKIYFDLGSTELTDEAAEVLDSFVVQEKNRATGVSIFGLTDRAGPAEYNQYVADKRARAVQSYLIQNGFDYSRITAVTGLGEDAAASVLDDNQIDAQQRAVVLFANQP